MSKSALLVLILVAALASPAAAQFSSGSTGADGALDVTANTVLPLPPTGVFHFTTVRVRPGVVLTFQKNVLNTPVIILAQGDVVVEGTIALNAGGHNVDGQWMPQIPGPGGFAGGIAGMPGLGPGGGQPSPDQDVRMARWVGPLSLVPIIGGSGGSGNGGDHGGGGGGAITIASSGTITVQGAGAIDCDGAGLGGSGGAIRLVANRVEATGRLSTRGCYYCAGWSGYDGYTGMIRIEAPSGQVILGGPGQGVWPQPVVTEINPEITRGNPPSLAIVSLGGQAVPAGAGTRWYAADILLPLTMPDPIPVVIAAQYVPVGTSVSLGFLTGAQGTADPCLLAGTYESSTCTINLTPANRGAVTYIYASAVFDVPPPSPSPDAEGAERVARVRATSRVGEPTQWAFLRADGTEADPARVPARLKALYR